MSAPTNSIPAILLKNLRPNTFDGRYRDVRAEDWFDRFERYCDAAQISAEGQDRILSAGLLLTDGASRWFKQLGPVNPARINNANLNAYQVFKYKFRQRFVDTNDHENAFDQIRELKQKRSVNEYVTVFERIRNRIPDFDDKDAVRFFRGGLKPELRQLVDNHPDIADDDINGLIALAERLDKMNKQERQASNNYRRPFFHQQSRTYTTNRETFPQPMEIDEIRMNSRFQTKPAIPSKSWKGVSKDEVKKSDLSNGTCFYCHNPGHLIGACPNRTKKQLNSKAH